MVKFKDELKFVDTVHHKDGKGTIQILDAITKEEMYGTGRFFGVTIIPPGCSIGLHRHTGDFETYYFLKGTAKVTDNGKEYILHAGDVLQCKDGDTHSCENIGQENLEYFAAILYSK